jgi:hypothetical protein
LGDLVGNRRVRPPSLDNRPTFVPVEEPEETQFGRDDSSSYSVQIVYTNGKGEPSERQVTCIKLQGFAEPDAIYAYCHQSKRAKSFRLDRMSECWDLATGELIDPVEHFRRLHLTGLMDMEDRALDHFSRLLVFMARCDGEFHPLENDAVDHALARYVLHFGGDDRTHEKAVRRLNGIAPDSVDLISAVKKIGTSAHATTLARLVLDCTGSVMNADGRHAPEEIEWAIEVSSLLKDAATGRTLS